MFLKLKGVEKLRQEMRKLAKEKPQQAKAALVQIANDVMDDSRDNYCPVKDGHLHDSGHVEPEESKLRVYMAYGGVSAPYAEVQHERTDFQHKIGESEFLKKPLLKKLPEIGSEIQRRCKV